MPFYVPDEEALHYYYKGTYYNLYDLAADLNNQTNLNMPLNNSKMDAKFLVQKWLDTFKNGDNNWEVFFTEDGKTTVREKNSFYYYH